MRDAAVEHFGKWLASEIAKRGQKVTEFAQKANVSASQMHIWLRSASPTIYTYNLGKLASALGVEFEEVRRAYADARYAFLPGGRGPSTIDLNAKKADEASILQRPERRIPIINKVAASNWGDFTNLDYPEGVADGYVRERIGDFALIVEGDCMEPKYRHGDIVIFANLDPEASNFVEGLPYAVQLDGGGDERNLFKLLFTDKARPELLIARALNPKRKRERITIERDKIIRLGVAVVHMELGNLRRTQGAVK